MSWTTPLTAVSNAALTAAQWNASVRDNLLETVPAKATTASSMFTGVGANSIVERVPQTALVLVSDSVSATSYANTTNAGPSVTATTATKALVAVSGWTTNSTGGASVYMAMDVTGATTIAAADTWALEQRDSAGTGAQNASRVHLETALTAGVNVFNTKYRVSSGAGTVQRRHITVLPF